MKDFADENFKFDENGRKVSKPVENTVGKGEIARYEQFLLFPQCFQKACFPGASKGVIVWEWVKNGRKHFGDRRKCWFQGRSKLGLRNKEFIYECFINPLPDDKFQTLPN